MLNLGLGINRSFSANSGEEVMPDSPQSGYVFVYDHLGNRVYDHLDQSVEVPEEFAND
jgi:hypothetical protein